MSKSSKSDPAAPQEPNGIVEAPMSRRRLLAGAGTALTSVGLMQVLAACGDSSTPAATTAAKATGGGGGGALGDQLRGLLKTPTGEAAGAGLEVPLGAIIQLTGPSQIYGESAQRGMNLAIEHIKAAGGPTFKLNALDDKSADPTAGAAAARQLGIAGTPICISADVGAVGSILPGIAQYKVFTIDAGGGVSGLTGKPFFYGSRPHWPIDIFAGVAQFLPTKLPDAKRVSIVTYATGDALVKDLDKGVTAALKANGLEQVGLQAVTFGLTDYSPVLAKLQQQKPDAIFMGLSGPDAANFLKQYASSGLTAQAIGSDYFTSLATKGGSSYDKFWFAFDYFDAASPPTKWADLFVAEYKKAYDDEDPDFFVADYYETTFVMWELLRRIVKSGGDVKSGSAYVTALEADPTVASLFSEQKGVPAGTMKFDPASHGLAQRAMGIYAANGASPELLATFNIGGKVTPVS